MPDILIRDWRVPKGCGVCPLNTGAFYCAGLKRYVIEEEHVWMGSNYRRLKDCPLHELPPHGDLIDRDALFKQMGITDMDCYKCEFGVHGFCGQGGEFSAACEAIEDAPAVIPSNKEETE